MNSQSASTATGDAISQFLFLSLDTIETLDRLSMPMFINGCLFIPSETLPALRQRIFLAVRISDSNEEAAVTGRVVWLNASPCGIEGLNRRGYGVQFESGAEEMENLIERAEDSRS